MATSERLIKETAVQLGLSESQAAQISGADIWRLYCLLLDLVGGDEDLARVWMSSPNKAFGDFAPIALITTPEGVAEICSYLEAMKH